MRIEHPIEHPNEEAGAGGECLRAAGLTLRYGDTVALDGIDLTVASGEVVVLMGPSGCGKSSLLRSLMRLAGPDAGSIRFAGRELMGLPEPELRAVRREIGFVFQRFNLVQRLSAEQNVMLGLLAGGESPNRAR
ncbi:MAG TPA: ATP-binding cassette domain-containing protein, partial [Limnochordia bacterium]|nr:ATP-binding cassette domain-containing protein [Limnochordia bacterium]